MQRYIEMSEYKGMWLFAMFDLPVSDKDDRRHYTRFRNLLLKDGFMMMQFSVYARYCADEEICTTHRKRVRKALPPAGHVSLLAVTDRQFGKIESYIGRRRRKNDEPPPQLMLF